MFILTLSLLGLTIVCGCPARPSAAAASSSATPDHRQIGDYPDFEPVVAQVAAAALPLPLSPLLSLSLSPLLSLSLSHEQASCWMGGQRRKPWGYWDQQDRRNFNETVRPTTTTLAPMLLPMRGSLWCMCVCVMAMWCVCVAARGCGPPFNVDTGREPRQRPHLRVRTDAPSPVHCTVALMAAVLRRCAAPWRWFSCCSCLACSPASTSLPSCTTPPHASPW